MNRMFYEVFIFCCIIGFAAHDFRCQRVPDRALAFFCPAALIAPLFHAALPLSWETLIPAIGFSLAGAATGFFILLTAALLSESGTGIGGGDIKLAALIGCVYGTCRVLAILLIASALALIPAIAGGKKHPNIAIALPFVPFLAIGTLVVVTIFSK